MEFEDFVRRGRAAQRAVDEILRDADMERLNRHEHLLTIWEGLPPNELAVDLAVLAQLIGFRSHQARVLVEALRAHAAGATHDCGEWRDRESCCQICGKSL